MCVCAYFCLKELGGGVTTPTPWTTLLPWLTASLFLILLRRAANDMFRKLSLFMWSSMEGGFNELGLDPQKALSNNIFKARPPLSSPGLSLLLRLWTWLLPVAAVDWVVPCCVFCDVANRRKAVCLLEIHVCIND